MSRRGPLIVALVVAGTIMKKPKTVRLRPSCAHGDSLCHLVQTGWEKPKEYYARL
jgi:hypothetical protein